MTPKTRLGLDYFLIFLVTAWVFVVHMLVFDYRYRLREVERRMDAVAPVGSGERE